jgi:hypothetical protein
MKIAVKLTLNNVTIPQVPTVKTVAEVRPTPKSTTFLGILIDLRSREDHKNRKG